VLDVTVGDCHCRLLQSETRPAIGPLGPWPEYGPAGGWGAPPAGPGPGAIGPLERPIVREERAIGAPFTPSALMFVQTRPLQLA
jgi:hypothetical protein